MILATVSAEGLAAVDARDHGLARPRAAGPGTRLAMILCAVRAHGRACGGGRAGGRCCLRLAVVQGRAPLARCRAHEATAAVQRQGCEWCTRAKGVKGGHDGASGCDHAAARASECAGKGHVGRRRAGAGIDRTTVAMHVCTFAGCMHVHALHSASNPNGTAALAGPVRRVVAGARGAAALATRRAVVLRAVRAHGRACTGGRPIAGWDPRN